MNDDEMDVALKEYGERWRAAQPAPPALPELPGRLRWPVVAGVAASVLAVVSAAGVVVVQRGDAPRPPVVARPTPKTQATIATVPWQPNPVFRIKRTTPPSAPPCADSDLDMTASFNPPQEGPARGVLEIRNTGTTTCLVQSKFSFLPEGSPWPDNLAVTQELGPSAVLAPGDVAVSRLSWSGQECSGTTDLDRIRLIPHTNEGLRDRVIPAVGLARGPCPDAHGDYGGGSWAVPAPRGLDRDLTRLTATIEAPESTRKGDPVRFTVTLANRTDEPVSFGPAGTPCPRVTFTLDSRHTRRHLLPCDDVPGRTIGPGEAVRFAFEVDTRRRGKLPLRWSFESRDYIGFAEAQTSVAVVD